MFQNYLPHLWSMSTSQTLFVNQTFRRSFAVFKKPHKLNKSVQVKKYILWIWLKFVKISWIDVGTRHFGSYKKSKLWGTRRAQRSIQCGKVQSNFFGRTVQKVCTVRFQVYFSLKCGKILVVCHFAPLLDYILISNFNVQIFTVKTAALNSVRTSPYDLTENLTDCVTNSNFSNIFQIFSECAQTIPTLYLL